MIGCPGELDIGQRTIPNYGGFDLGMVSLSRAFANSCNTTFAELASRMPPRALSQAANRYGIGVDYLVDGITTVTGSVPPTVDLAERTEDGFGQGRVLASPTIISEKKMPIDSELPALKNVDRTPEAAPR